MVLDLVAQGGDVPELTLTEIAAEADAVLDRYEQLVPAWRVYFRFTLARTTMSENRITDQFPEDGGARQPTFDLGPLLDAASEAFDKLTPDEQTAFLQQAEQSRERQKRQQIADMESQFNVDHGLSTFREYQRSAETGHEIIKLLSLVQMVHNTNFKGHNARSKRYPKTSVLPSGRKFSTLSMTTARAKKSNVLTTKRLPNE